jgi:membrane protein
MRDQAKASVAAPSDRSFVGALKRTWRDFSDERILAVAAGCAFYLLLAMFPAMAALVSIYGLFADPAAINSHVAALSGILPGGGMEIIGHELKRITSQGGGRLGLAFALGLVVALWSANAGVKALFDALNVAYDEKERRSFIRLNATSLLFTFLTLLFAIAAIGLLAAAPVLLDRVGVGSLRDMLLAAARWPALIVATLFGLAVLYRYGPDRATPKLRWVTWGSALATILWIVMSAAFAWYAAHFGSYDKTYGSLGAVVGFMTWIWLSATIVLLGAELNCEIERREPTRGAQTSDAA